MIPHFFYGSGMYRKHQNHTYGRNQNDSANNWAIVKIASNLKQWSEFIINLCWTSMLIQISFPDKCPLTAGSCALRAAGCCTVVYIMFIAILLCSLGLWRQGKAVQYATAVGGNATHKRWQSDDIHFMASLSSCAVLHIVIKTANMFKKPLFLTLQSIHSV